MQIKTLNPEIATELKETLKRNDVLIELKREPGVDTYTVIDPEGKKLISYTNGWDYGLYSIDFKGQNVANIEWRENDNKTTAEQKAVFDIFDIISKKYQAQEAIKRLLATMSDEDKACLSMMLQRRTNKPEKQK